MVIMSERAGGVPSSTSTNEGLEEEGLKVTMLYSKFTKQVLCLETRRDFVDMLVGFFTLPMGCIVRLLSEAAPPPSALDQKICDPDSSSENKLGLMITNSGSNLSSNGSCNSKGRGAQQRPLCKEARRNGGPSPLTSIANVYQSIAKMDDGYFNASKAQLLDPRPLIPFGGRLLPVIPVPQAQASKKKGNPVNCFCCGIACNFVCSDPGTKCPRHKRRMETPCESVDEDEAPPTEHMRGQLDETTSTEAAMAASSGGGEGGRYVREGEFIVTNTMEIYSTSSSKGLMHLNVLMSERVSDLENLEIIVTAAEARKQS